MEELSKMKIGCLKSKIYNTVPYILSFEAPVFTVYNIIATLTIDTCLKPYHTISKCCVL